MLRVRSGGGSKLQQPRISNITCFFFSTRTKSYDLYIRWTKGATEQRLKLLWIRVFEKTHDSRSFFLQIFQPLGHSVPPSKTSSEYRKKNWTSSNEQPERYTIIDVPLCFVATRRPTPLFVETTDSSQVWSRGRMYVTFEIYESSSTENELRTICISFFQPHEDLTNESFRAHVGWKNRFTSASDAHSSTKFWFSSQISKRWNTKIVDARWLTSTTHSAIFQLHLVH